MTEFDRKPGNLKDGTYRDGDGFKALGRGLLKVFGILIATALVGCLLFRLLFVDYIEQHELPYMFDRMTGQVSILPHTGYIVTMPFVVKVYGIDLRPHQVLLQVGYSSSSGSTSPSANSRVLNAKLVQFNPAGLKEFIALHGLQEGDVSEILKIYAFDQENKSYPFLKVEAGTGSGLTFAPTVAK